MRRCGPNSPTRDERRMRRRRQHRHGWGSGGEDGRAPGWTMMRRWGSGGDDRRTVHADRTDGGEPSADLESRGCGSLRHQRLHCRQDVNRRCACRADRGLLPPAQTVVDLGGVSRRLTRPPARLDPAQVDKGLPVASQSLNLPGSMSRVTILVFELNVNATPRARRPVPSGSRAASRPRTGRSGTAPPVSEGSIHDQPAGLCPAADRVAQQLPHSRSPTHLRGPRGDLDRSSGGPAGRTENYCTPATRG